MKNYKAIHQFTPTVAFGDSVSNGLIFTQKLLHSMGFESQIYICDMHVDRKFCHEVYNIQQYVQSADQILLYHHSIGHKCHEKIMNFLDDKILVYHNITPSHFFKEEKHLQVACDEGREQLKSAVSHFIGSYADSLYNCKELRYYNYKKPISMPILIDLDKKVSVRPNEHIVQKYHNTYNILFVGRVVQNKCQHQLIDVMFQLKQKNITNIKLFIVGGISQQAYFDYLIQYAFHLGLKSEVVITNKVSDEDLVAYYKLADLYLSLSEHEGFGMPFIEAMKYDIPILTYNAGGIASTVVQESLLEKKAPDFIADQIIRLQNDPFFRVDLLQKQKKHLRSFSVENIKNSLIEYLNSLEIKTPPKSQIEETKERTFQIEGPFDSTYSLAIVNKNIAQALSQEPQTDIKLYSTEGTGDFEANLDNIDKDTKRLAINKIENVDVTIRNLYPPRTNAMAGYHKIIGPYGWEESKFPAHYVSWFNTKLTMAFTMSEYVKDVLINNGVSIPIQTTGIIVEDILAINSKAFSFDLPSGLRLLHISSCFPRKGIDILIDTFELLENKKEISLVIKTFENPHNNVIEYLENKNYTVVTTYEKNVYLYSKNGKKILLINKDIPQSQIKYLYENTNILVAPSFGEGFGLPMAEAMLLDLPVLTTNYGGQKDFCTSETSWLIDFDFALAQTHLNLQNSVWAVPKIESLKTNIEDICSLSQKEIQKKTTLAKEHILKNYSSQKVSKNILQAIKNYDNFKQTQKKKVGWISSYNTKCGIATYSEFILENLQNIDITLFANHSTSVINQNKEKNVVRCWNDRFDETNQALISQIIDGSFTDVVINFNFAFFSMQNLAQIINTLDENNIKVTIIFHSVADVTIKGIESSLSWIKKSLKRVKHILVHNVEDLNFFKNLDLLNAKFLPHGVTNRVDIKPKIQKGITSISSYGFMLPHKGILDLINAFSIVEKEFQNISLVLVNAVYPVKTSEDYLNRCKQRVHELNLSHKVTFHSDFLSDEKSYELLDTTDLLVMPYHKTNESASGAIRYAISTLNPVLCTQEPIFNDVKDIVHFIEGDSIDDIAQSIKKFITNKTLLYSKYEEQKAWLEEHDWKNISLKVANFLR